MNNSHRYSPLFSITVFASLALAGSGSYFLVRNDHKVTEAIRKEPEVLQPITIPTVEVPPAPLVLDEVKIDAPKPKAVVKPPTPKAKVAIASVTKAAKPCELACGDWLTSAYGTRYKSCECK